MLPVACRKDCDWYECGAEDVDREGSSGCGSCCCCCCCWMCEVAVAPVVPVVAAAVVEVDNGESEGVVDVEVDTVMLPPLVT